MLVDKDWKRVQAQGSKKGISPRERLAFHEAGHAVMAFITKRPMRKVTIVPDPAKGTKGYVKHKPLPKSFQPDVNIDTRTRMILENEIMCFMAGVAAEFILTGRRNWRLNGKEHDREQAINLLSYLDSGKAARHYWKLLWLWTVGRLWSSWSAVQAVAEALLEKKTLSGKEVRSVILEKAREHTPPFNMPSWVKYELEGKPPTPEEIAKALGFRGKAR